MTKKVTLYPTLELVTCCYNLGDFALARHHYELSKGFAFGDGEEFLTKNFSNK